jgi:hypothetical protein
MNRRTRTKQVWATVPPDRASRSQSDQTSREPVAERIADRPSVDSTATTREWDEFEGEATRFTILAGVGSVEELRIPSRNFSGMGLRLLDVENQVWNDFWVNAKSGVLTTPGQTGSFENGVGTFGADDTDDGKPIKVKGVWDKITPTSWRWWQAVSWDDGKTWEENWVMEWTRVK